MHLNFVYPWILFAAGWLIPAVAIWWYSANKSREKRISSFISSDMQGKISPHLSTSRFTWQTCLIISGLFLMLVAAARPQWGTKEQTVYSRGRDLIILLDVSRSMLANDVHPNRLSRAKIDIIDLIKELRGDRAALMAFRQKAILLCPLTTDYTYLNQALNGANIDSAPRGETDIGDAILSSLESFDNDNSSHKAIILISDGEDISGKAIAAAKTAKERNIPIFTIGIGSQSGSRIPSENKMDGYIKHQGKEVTTKLNNETLYNIAKTTGGKYIPIATASTTIITLGDIYQKHLRKISEQDLEETLVRRRVERFQIFLFPALLLLLAGAVMSRGRLAVKKKDPLQHLKQLSILISLSILPFNADAQTNLLPSTTNDIEQLSSIPVGRDGARIAQKLYRFGKYDEAANVYIDATRGSSSQSQQDFKYNAAVSKYKAGNFQESADIFRDILNSERSTDSKVAMGLGAALYRSAKQSQKEPDKESEDKALLLKKAAEAYRTAARASDNQSAKENMAVILQQLPEAQEQALINKLMAKYGQTDASQLTMEMLTNQREINELSKSAFTNNSPSMITDLETAASKQKENAELWIPLKEKLLMAAQQSKEDTSQQQLQELNQHIEAIRANMNNTANQMRNLQPSSQNGSAKSEAAIYSFWKSIAQYPHILKEDINIQSNCLIIASHSINKNQFLAIAQQEASSLSDLFLKSFTETVPEVEESNMVQQLPTTKQDTDSTNQTDQISAEDRAKIITLANTAISAQKTALALITANNPKGSLPDQHIAYNALKEIEKLLPKNKDSQNQKQNNQQQDQDKDKQQEDPQQNEKQEQQENQPEQTPEEQTPEDIKQLLNKAIQREKDHEDEKRERMRNMPMSPMDKDW